MAGIYLHIPFCKQACHYCDFHFSTSLSRMAEMTRALLQELYLRKDYLGGTPVTSIYFGGGTPSLLPCEEIQQLLSGIGQHYALSADAEITLEANPDDLSIEKLKDLKAAGINRLSIGVQTFDDARLRFINRAHTAHEARACLHLAQDAGFDNLTADLIYAIPPDDAGYWRRDLETMLAFDLPHLSIYGLTLEDKTVFGQWAKKGKLQEVSETTNAYQYRMAMDLLTAHGYVHYEVSNFAKDGKFSRHNKAYWEGDPYLGVGPGAHSYNGESRSFNVSNNAAYLVAMARSEPPLTVEKLTTVQKANEYLLTHLRTRRGIALEQFKTRFSRDLLADFGPAIEQFTNANLMARAANNLILTSEGFMLADEILVRLFYDE